MKHIISKVKWKKVMVWLLVIAIIIIGGVVGFRQLIKSRLTQASTENVIRTAKVEQRDIQNVLSSSGTVSPLNSYEIRTLVEGEIIAANFEEGDTVEKGQVLYQIATDTLDNKIDKSQTTLDRANTNYTKAKDNYEDTLKDLQKAQKDYQNAQGKYSLVVKASDAGMIKTLLVKEGDTIQKGTQIAEIYDNSSMQLVIPFAASVADSSLVGKKAEVTIESSDEVLEGVVTKVSALEETLSGNRLVKQVTIQVTNPGGITNQTTATAAIGNQYSSDIGTFQVLTQTMLISETSGEIDKLSVTEGSRVKKGDTVLTLTGDSVEDQLDAYASKVESAQKAVDNAKDGMETAEQAIEDAQSDLQEVIDSRTDYSITAPVTGKVISKSSLAGDTINSVSSLCTIYDLSAVTFEMNVDELDVMKVKVGQEVNVKADAFEGTTFQGVVTNISLASNANSGVTQYPVTVKISEAGDLLPGMNVTGEIIIEKAEGVLAIPSDALMRGDVVYVKDDTVKEAQGNIPAGFRQVEVETGITDGNYIEIKSGLSGDEEVYEQRISEAVSANFPNGMQGFDMRGFTGGAPSGQRSGGSFSGGNFGGGNSGGGSSGGTNRSRTGMSGAN